MGKTSISWTDFSFNPWVGCTKVSPACDHCYAQGWAIRTGHAELWKGERRRTSASNWREPHRWNRAAAAAGRRDRVFCASLADVFDNQVPEAWRDDLWRLIEATPSLDWLLLTKRPQNIWKMLPSSAFGVTPWGGGWPNVWLGTTIENREEWGRRRWHLNSVRTRRRFLSVEPLLEDLGEVDLDGIDWVIVGGESGPGARPMHPAWARSLRDQCVVAGVAFHFKQWGQWAPSDDGDGDTLLSFDGRRDWIMSVSDQPAAMNSVGKARAGREIDGRTWDEVPA